MWGERNEHHNPLDAWKKEADKLWDRDAYRILLQLTRSDAVFVDAQAGSGKTHFLTPELIRQAPERHWVARRVTLTEQLPNFGIDTLPVVPEDSLGVIIADESGRMTRDDYRWFREFSEHKGYEKTVFMPAGITAAVRTELIKNGQQHLRELDRSSAVYKMQLKKIPDKLAQQYLTLRGVPKEAIEFALQTFPTSPGILEQLSYYHSPDAMRQWWEDNRDELWRYERGITHESFKAVEKRLYPRRGWR